jgi:hypothetical protein
MSIATLLSAPAGFGPGATPEAVAVARKGCRPGHFPLNPAAGAGA